MDQRIPTTSRAEEMSSHQTCTRNLIGLQIQLRKSYLTRPKEDYGPITLPLTSESLSRCSSASIPSSHHTDDQPFFTKLDYVRTSQRPMQTYSRAPSISSQENGTHTPSMNPDQLALQLEQFAMSSDSRPLRSYRGSNASNTMFTQVSPVSWTSPFSRTALGSMNPSSTNLRRYARAPAC